MATSNLFGVFSGLGREPERRLSGDIPLVIAIHGGSYCSRYFDIRGYSLLDRAAALGLLVLAPDRNGYGATPILPEATIANSARALAVGLREAWKCHGSGCRGVVLIGHSIGGAIAAHIASDPGELPLLGIAISGLGLRMPERNRSVRAALPETAFVQMPAKAKDALMFGPPGSFDDRVMPAASHAADAPAPKAELHDIAALWPENARSVLAAIHVPVHYRQGEFDRLWVVNAAEVSDFARALENAPSVDAAMIEDAGHCIDYHRISPAFHHEQLGFAVRCAIEAGPAPPR